jgi:nucleotide-binding universal stress UspA family protein
MPDALESFRRVIVPIDFVEADDDSEAAFVADVEGRRIAFSSSTILSARLGASLAAASGGRLRLVHATPPMHTNSIYAGPLTVPTQIIAEIHDRSKDISTAALSMFVQAQIPGSAPELIVEPANPLQLVLDQAKEWPADLVVMAASGRNRVARFFVGSTADRVIRQCICPVLVVPADSRA